MASPYLSTAQRNTPAALSIQLLKQRSTLKRPDARGQQAARHLSLPQQQDRQSTCSKQTAHCITAYATDAVAQRPISDAQSQPISNGRQESLPSSAAAKAPAAPKKHPPSTSPSQVESLRLLEWPAVCQQVACFTTTAMAAERCLAAKLPMAASQHPAEQLLQETAEAQQARLVLKGIHDLRRLLETANRNRVLHPVHLDAVASTLEVAAAVAHEIQRPTSQQQGTPQEAQRGPSPFPALMNLGRGIKGALPELRQSIRHCIEGGRVLDRASARLAETRQERRSNMQTLRQGMNDWARQLATQGVSEEALVVIRRDRLCVPVRAGRQSQLPKGSVTLASSASGSTVYMEPEPVVALNNAEAMLAGQEEEEEQAILAHLTQLVKASEMSIQRMLKAVTALDIACARAKHADWCSGVKPSFLTRQEADKLGSVRARRVYHPLLLEPALDSLKEPPATDPPSGFDPSQGPAPSSSTAADAFGRASWEAAPAQRQSSGAKGRRGQAKGNKPCPVDLLVPPGATLVNVTGPNTGGKTASLKTLGLMALMAKSGLFIPLAHDVAAPPATLEHAPSQPASSSSKSSSHTHSVATKDPASSTDAVQGNDAFEASSQLARQTKLDQPMGEPLQNGAMTREQHLQHQQQQGSAEEEDVVGQRQQQGTAHEEDVRQQHQQQATAHEEDIRQQPQHQETADGEGVGQQQQQSQHSLQPRLVFFEQVLADVGDAQNLQQSLSTFSGHIRRLQGVLQDLTPHSLVLLDEVGSGTDPGEGAALAGALLDALAGRAALTYATTHHAELTKRAAEDTRFVNASVEFDLASLRPTYRLVWGQGGQSNALAVAQGLGFDPTLVNRAREIAAHRKESETASAKAAGLKQSLEEQLQQAQQEASQAAAARAAAQQELTEAQQQAQELSQQQEALKASGAGLKAEVSAVQDELRSVVKEVSAGRMSHQEAEEWLQQVADSVPSLSAATAAVKKAQQSGEDEALSAAEKQHRKAWRPKVGDQVRLSKAGGGTGKVAAVGEAGELTIQLGALSVQANAADVTPLFLSKASRAAQARAASNSPAKDRQSPKASASGSKKEQPNTSSSKPATVDFQADFNTVDVRGQRSDQALAEVEAALGSVPTGCALFVVHGVATGRLRTEIHQFLSRHSQVDRYVLAKDSSGGCTAVYLK